MNHQVNIDDHVEAMENMALFHGVDPSKRQRTSSPQTSSRSAGVEDAIIPLNSDPRSKKPHTIYTHPFFIPKVRPSREEPPLQSMLFAKQNSGGSPLVRISQNQWIDIDTAYQNEIAQRLAFFRKNKGQVFCAFEGRAALEELYQELIIRLLPARYPTIFRKLRNENVVSSSQSGAACGEMPAYSGGMDPKKLLNMIASNITEDVYVFAKDAKGVYRLSAAISAYPNGFSVSERDRKSLDEFARANLKFANQAGAEQLKNLRLGEYFSRMTASIPSQDSNSESILIFPVGPLPLNHAPQPTQTLRPPRYLQPRTQQLLPPHPRRAPSLHPSLHQSSHRAHHKDLHSQHRRTHSLRPRPRPLSRHQKIAREIQFEGKVGEELEELAGCAQGGQKEVEWRGGDG